MKKTFDFNEVPNFDQHIMNSIPNYSGLSGVFQSLSLEYINSDSVCVDIGCSTGRFIKDLEKIKGAQYIGVDHNKLWGEDFSMVQFVESDVVNYLKALEHADVVVCMFVLQFLGKERRKAALKELSRLVYNGAVLLLSEKVYLGDSRINQVLHKGHLEQKRKFFNDDEILDKEQDLAGCMFCKTDSEITLELDMFPNYEQVWQSYNFKAWCIF